jgi:hypothetical protein
VDGIAGDVKTYVDDKRPTGQSYQHCREVAHCTASTLSYLGMQDASRKRELPSLRAGAWSGVVCHTDSSRVTVLCTQDKWEKAQGYVWSLLQTQVTSNLFHHKELERIQGFLIYVIHTYPSFTPNLKGIHLTLDSWRSNRDAEGWWVLNAIQHHYSLDNIYNGKASPPETVRGVPRLGGDLQALSALFAPEHPPRQIIRSNNVLVTLYGFGDASGEGFGSTLMTPEGLHYRYGLWGRDLSHQSSNFREMRNLVDMVDLELKDDFPVLEDLVTTVSNLVESDTLPSTEIFLFTDNSVAEGAFFRGTSSNPRLFSLILHLPHLEMHHSLRLHVVHISGKRMITQGTIGLSCGDLDAGVMRGEHMLSFIPLHLGVVERFAGLLQWVTQWAPDLLLRPLSLMEWFTLGHGITSYSVNTDGVTIPEYKLSPQVVLVWSPPPAAAEAALDELSLSRHKRPHLKHLLFCPRLFTHTWRKKLYKMADFVFFLPSGRKPRAWPVTMYEPLMVGIFLPLLEYPPWCLRQSPAAQQLDTDLRACWASSKDDTALLSRVWQLDSLT